MVSSPYSTWLLDSSSVVQLILTLVGPIAGSTGNVMTGFVVSTVVVVVPPVDDVKNASSWSPNCQ